MKKIIALSIAILLIFNLTLSVVAADKDTPFTDEIIDEYANIRSASVLLSISASGVATINVDCVGFTGTTHITALTYLEKWNGASWDRTTINGYSQVSTSANTSWLQDSYTTSVSKGKYRATTKFTVTKGTDEIIFVRSSTVIY